MALAEHLVTLRRSPLLRKLPPYLSLLCVVVGIAWLLILPLDDYSRRTYISENAILPGQVHAYFGGSEHNVFRAYRQETYHTWQLPEEERAIKLGNMLRDMGLKVAEQDYRYTVAGEDIRGKNVYGVLHGPRADATEAMVLIAAWRNFEQEVNYSGVALALTLARYFKRWSIWSKDIIILFPSDSVYGPQAWVSAYHSMPPPLTAARNVSALPLKAGALQAAIALDYPAGPWGHRFDKLDIVYDGINGALPNLDLLNTAVQVCASQMGISSSLHGLVSHSDSYTHRLQTLFRGLLTQSAGHATGPHSAFMPYHVDAITLKTVGDGWHDEMSLGRTAESLMRSVNNLLEHLHQSFFFYILISVHRFVSIGNYLPAAMLVAGSFTISALALWVSSGRSENPTLSLNAASAIKLSGEKLKMDVVKVGGDVAIVPHVVTAAVERKMFLPAFTVLAVHVLSALPIYLLNHVHQAYLTPTLYALTALSILILPALAALFAHPKGFGASTQQRETLQAFSLLLLAATLSTLATLNFSLAFAIGVLASPLAFARPLPSILPSSKPSKTGEQAVQPASLHAFAITLPVLALYILVSPPVLFCLLPNFIESSLSSILVQMARAWAAQGVWTGFIIWAVWWPAWILGSMVVVGGSLGLMS